MKKLTLCIMAAFFMLAVIPAQLSAATEPTTTAIAATKPTDSEIAVALTARLDEIKNMDKTGLSPSEKKELRQEVRSIKSQLKDIGKGVYLSVGAIIIIVLLLILLL